MTHLKNVALGFLITLALVSVPTTIYISGQQRNAADDKLCDYAKSQWDATHAVVLRFTAPGSVDRRDALAPFGPFPTC